MEILKNNIDKTYFNKFTEKVDKSIYDALKNKNYVDFNLLFYDIYDEMYTELLNIKGNKEFSIYSFFDDDEFDKHFSSVKEIFIDTDKTSEKLREYGFIERNIENFQENIFVYPTEDHNKKALICFDGEYLKVFTMSEIDNTLLKDIKKCYVKSKKDDDNIVEVGIASMVNGSYSTDWVNIKKMSIDINKNYNDDLDIEKFDNFIEKEETGLALLYGEPGTGKSSFIRYLIQKHDKKDFVLIDPDLFSDISSKSFLTYLTSVPETIFIIEDGEKLLADREHSYNPIIGTFLNMSDGILASAIKCKFICTFNTELSNIDKALLRKGRMKLKYEFKKLAKNKAMKLAAEFNPNLNVTGDMSLADIFNIEENDLSKEKHKKIGF